MDGNSVSIGVSFLGVLIGLISAFFSWRSSKSSKESADASGRSADAAEAIVSIERSRDERKLLDAEPKAKISSSLGGNEYNVPFIMVHVVNNGKVNISVSRIYGEMLGGKVDLTAVKGVGFKFPFELEPGMSSGDKISLNWSVLNDAFGGDWIGVVDVTFFVELATGEEFSSEGMSFDRERFANNSSEFSVVTRHGK